MPPLRLRPADVKAYAKRFVDRLGGTVLGSSADWEGLLTAGAASTPGGAAQQQRVQKLQEGQQGVAAAILEGSGATAAAVAQQRQEGETAAPAAAQQRQQGQKAAPKAMLSQEIIKQLESYAWPGNFTVSARRPASSKRLKGRAGTHAGVKGAGRGFQGWVKR